MRRPGQLDRLALSPTHNLLEPLVLGQDKALDIWAFLDVVTRPLDKSILPSPDLLLPSLSIAGSCPHYYSEHVILTDAGTLTHASQTP